MHHLFPTSKFNHISAPGFGFTKAGRENRWRSDGNLDFFLSTYNMPTIAIELCVSFCKPPVIWAAWMARCLRARTTLEEDQSWIPSVHVRQFHNHL